MLKRFAATKAVLANPQHCKQKQLILASIALQQPLLERIRGNPGEIIERLKPSSSSPSSSPSIGSMRHELRKKAEERLCNRIKWIYDRAQTSGKLSPDALKNIFDPILIHAAFSGAGEERIFGEDLALSDTPDEKMAEFAFEVGRAWEKTIREKSTKELGINEKFGAVNNPAHLLFALSGDSPKRMGAFISQIEDEKLFVLDLQSPGNTTVSPRSLIHLKNIYGMEMELATIEQAGKRLELHIGSMNNPSIGVIHCIKQAQARINLHLVQITKRLTIGFNEMFGNSM